MKLHCDKTFATTCIVIAMVILVPGCKKDDPAPVVTEVQKVTQLLTSDGGTWSTSAANAITVDGVDVTQDLFPNFAITFSENTFTTTGTSPVWLREDTWSFKDATAQVIIRGQDSKELTITGISNTQLTFTLTWDQTTYEGGRKKSLAGAYVFTLTK
jgi:hypothetical protein